MIHRFLDFELDETLFELRFGGEVVTTQTRVFAFITYLLRHRARVIGKEELIRELWKAQLVTDAAISQVVMLARKALRDEGDQQRIIKTVRGRGFRFVADVADAAVVENSDPKPTNTRDAPVTPLPAKTRAFPTLGPAGSGLPVVEPAAPTGPVRAIAAIRGNIFGRESELRELTQLIAATRDGRGGLVLIEGEPGIGKTTLASELATLATESGLDVQWGRSWEEGGAPPFWPWVQVLRGLVATEGEERVLSFMGHRAPELFTLLPELASAGNTFASDGDHARAQFRLFDAMASFLRKACGAADSGRRPRLFVLDDLHAVDEASVQMLRFLAPELEHAGLLIIGTFRDLELQRQPALAQLASACAESQRVRLKSLTEADVANWLERKLGRTPAPLLTRSLYEVSCGNPLLLAELSRRFERDQPERIEELRALANEPLPTRILRAVRSHLSELPAQTMQVLAAASALGREFPLSVLAPLRACSEAELLEQLGPALQRGVVQHASSPDRLIFSHAMVCQAVYADMSAAARLELHRKIAELLAELHGPARAPLYEVAHHYALAAASGCRPQALHYARRAALRAADMRAFEVAAELYDRCVALAEAEGLDNEALHELLCAAGEAWYRVGQLEHANARYGRAAELARAEHNAERFAAAVLSSASVLRGVVLYDRNLQLQLRDALELLPQTDSPLRAGLLAASALSLRSGTIAERNRASLAAIEMGRRLNDDGTLQWLLNARHLAMWGSIHPRELLASTSEMMELARKTGDTEVLLDALMWRVTDHSESGDIPSAHHDVETYRFEVERSGSPWHRYMLHSVDTFRAQVDGNFALAREESKRGWQLGLRLREPLADAFYCERSLFHQIDEGLVHGDPERRAASEVREPPACVPSDHRPLWALAWAIQDKSLDAERSVTQFLSHDAAGLVLDAIRRPLLAVMSQVCWLLDDDVQAARLYPLLLPSAGLHMLLQSGVYLGPVSFYLGLLATTLSQLEAAAKHFDKALVECATGPTWVARVQHAYGVALARAPGQEARACQHLRGGHAAAVRFGMADLREACRSQLDRLSPSDGSQSDAPVTMA
ncbi:MAG TPA: AAA family ATPase [Polyangiales bacterium]|nr:AAA family ATPase [Polyangiales bacterium]